MQAGKLRHRVTLRESTEAQDTYGESIKTFADVATVWAEVVQLSGREYLQAREAGAETTTRITIRKRSGVHEKMRITWGTHSYDVDAVLPDPTNARHILLMCSEVTS